MVFIHSSNTTVDMKWTNRSGKTNYAVGGPRNVLLIVADDDLSKPDVVQRRPSIEMTEELRKELEDQGIAREDQCDDMTIFKARYILDERHTITEIEAHGTRDSALKNIATLMKNTLMKKHDDEEGGGM